MSDPTPAENVPSKATGARRNPARTATPRATTAKAAPAAKAAAASKTPAAKTPAAKTPAANTPAAKAPTSKAPVAGTTAAKTTAANTTTAKTPAAKTPATKTPAAKAPAAATTAAATTAEAPAKAVPARRTRTAAPKAPAETAATPAATAAPVEPAPATAAPAAATAPAGWYPVEAGSPKQRYWDGNVWTEHFHDPSMPAAASAAAASAAPGSIGYAPAPVARVRPVAPEGTSPNTVWGWLTALSPLLAIAQLIPTAIYFNALGNLGSNFTDAFAAANTSVAYYLSLVLGLVVFVAYILFPLLDWLALRKRGVPAPFHWAWSLTSIVVSSPIVYVIGRTVVARRRTGKGLAPLWVFIAVQVVEWIIGAVVLVFFLIALAGEFANLAASLSGVS